METPKLSEDMSRLTKVGQLTEITKILPYYGDYDDWMKLYYLAWKDTQAMFKRNRHLFRKFDNDLFGSPHLENNRNLKIDMKARSPNDKARVQNILQTRFNRIQRFTLLFGCGIGTSDGLKISGFMRNCLPHSIKYLYMRGGPNYLKFDKIRNGLVSMLPKVTGKVTFVNFSFSQQDIELVFDGWTRVTELAFYSCNVLDLNDQLRFDHYKSHQLRFIDFQNTWDESDAKKINADKLTILVKELSKTDIKKWLKTIKMSSTLFSINKAQSMIEQHGLESSILAHN